MRTSFFMKENKYYTTLNFCLPFAYVMILGFFFTENTDKVNVLHRDQTDEWKGWMQLVILIYHLTGASKVLFRMNILVVTLCFVMNRPYQFYYFVPLVSFWYLVIYLVMTIPPHVTAQSSEANPMQYLYMTMKFVALIVVICLFYLSEVFFEKVFLTRPFKALFVTSDDSIHEWRFRWQLDRFSPVYGMLFAFGYKVLVRYKIIKDDGPQNLFSNPISWSLCVLSLIGIATKTQKKMSNQTKTQKKMSNQTKTQKKMSNQTKTQKKMSNQTKTQKKMSYQTKTQKKMSNQTKTQKKMSNQGKTQKSRFPGIHKACTDYQDLNIPRSRYRYRSIQKHNFSS
ncbi:N-acetylneuraminate 9-O-acetyltransferase [Bulinus truncatus]|nr:N-acetylneuraminate 9-O-acetyltransferase [Bulinus truncatus]